MIGKIIFNSEISKTLENIKSKEISSKFKELRNNELDIKKDKEKGSISTFQEADKPLFLEKEDYTSRELEKIKGLEKNDIIN
ncbi:MAG: hypothetical protein SPD90_09565, partial [Intestinibacter sp.]|uniref:hypothetical protein n=1 Tax=Intestinibacter sp. TaxID=1965304 RepID=UPI002A8360AC